MVQAYILIQTEVRKAHDVVDAIAKIGSVGQVNAVTGPYDVVVLAETDDEQKFDEAVIRPLTGVDGITRMITCRIVHL